MRRIAIIPARGGSKRIPNKNIRDFCGKPMITYILNVAKNSGLFNTIHVSTESNIIRHIVESHGFSTDFLRPAKLADDRTPIMPVLKYTIEEYGRRGTFFDEVWLLMACSPLTTEKHLITASKLFHEKGAKSPVLSVTEYPAPIEWAFRKSKSGALVPIQNGMFEIRSQDIEKAYYDSGNIAVFPTSLILTSEGAGCYNHFVGLVLPKNSAIDIDDEDDWAIAEALFRSSS